MARNYAAPPSQLTAGTLRRELGAGHMWPATGNAMSNRKERRRSASVKRHAKPATKADQRQLLLFVGAAVLAAIAGAALLTLIR